MLLVTCGVCDASGRDDVQVMASRVVGRGFSTRIALRLRGSVKSQQIDCLLAAIELGSIRKASVHLNVSQPSVTQQIRKMEEDLNVVLLRRTSMGVTPTAAGVRLSPFIKSIQRLHRSLQAEADSVNGLAVGSLVIAAIPIAIRRFLPDVVRMFRSSYPMISFRLIEASSRNAVRAVAEGEADLGLVSHWDNAPRDDGDNRLVYEDFLKGQTDIYLFAPAGSKFVGQTEVVLGDLSTQEFIVMSKGHILRDAYDQVSQKFHLSHVYETTSATSAEALVKRGLGVSFLPKSYHAEGDESVISMPIRHDFPAVSYSLVRRAEEMPTTTMSVFTKMLKRTTAGT